MYFEGSEKKVELIMSGRGPCLRSFRDLWPRVVAKAKAEILSRIANERCDAYLLSESSLFVFSNRLVMITCGTTSLVSAIEAMFEFLDPRDVQLLMYERKNEHFPQVQESNFQMDIRRLEAFFPGVSHRFGDEHGNHVFLFHYGREFVPKGHDMTLEILMHDLSPRARARFQGQPAEVIHEETGLDRVFEGFLCDDHVFDPMGYSLNGIMGQEYYTVHVTPEKKCSYASFETNHLFRGDLEKTIEWVLDVFEPQNVSLLFFENKGMNLYQPRRYLQEKEASTKCCGYWIWFRNFTRNRESTMRARG